MKNNKLTHVDENGNPLMVNISGKTPTSRKARARAVVRVGSEIIQALQQNNLQSKKGSVTQTAIIAGIMGAKKTSELIPLCHPLSLNHCTIQVHLTEDALVIESEAETEGKTGVEMEALTAASVAALTVYDMCKAMSHEIVIESIRLLEKTGGKKDYKHED